MKYIYGPVKSRRLGLSLGLSLTPYKVCNLDCVYCQLGKTKELTSQRGEYVKADDILGEFKSWLQQNPDSAKELNFVTISGQGEPTLNINLGYLIAQIRKLINARIAVITNSTLLNDPRLRLELLGADLIVPSLDSVRPEVFARIDRPHKGVRLESIIEGLTALRKEFRGQIWLEIMLVAGINDTLPQLKEFKDIVERIKPDKIQLNSPVRSTTECNVLPVERKKLEKFREVLGDRAEII